VQLSSMCGLSVRFISNLERGKVHDPTLTQIVRIAMGLKHPVTDLIDQVEIFEQKLNTR